MKEFVGEYQHNGRKVCLNINGDTISDALARVESIKASFVVLGQLGGITEEETPPEQVGSVTSA